MTNWVGEALEKSQREYKRRVGTNEWRMTLSFVLSISFHICGDGDVRFLSCSLFLFYKAHVLRAPRGNA